jgi:hypothetical protein
MYHLVQRGLVGRFLDITCMWSLLLSGVAVLSHAGTMRSELDSRKSGLHQVGSLEQYGGMMQKCLPDACCQGPTPPILDSEITLGPEIVVNIKPAPERVVYRPRRR